MKKVRLKNQQKPKRVFRTRLVSFFILVVLLSSVLMLQYYRITKINLSIRDLEDKVKNQEMLNDSIQGELLAKRDLDKIEKIATKEYGMVKSVGQKATYVSVNYDTSNEAVASNSNQSKGLLGWLSNLIR